ncbi:MAG: hypothetical protein JO115_09080 [Pseudonocardiales bacterium]|nr:hypothetical protein [Pseudonocardiales bacterium]
MVVQTDREQVWMSWPPFTWEAILDPVQVADLMHVLVFAREEAMRDGGSSR